MITNVPLQPEGAERWIVGATYAEQAHTAWTRAFDVHPVQFILSTRPHAWAWYRRQTKPIYLVEATPKIPSSVTYPRAALERFGLRGACALSSTIDQMMALALLEDRYTEIRLEGVRMLSRDEWVDQRECLAYWIGRAEERGIAVIVDPVSALCAPEQVYGYGDPTGAVRAPGQPVVYPAPTRVM